MPHPQFTAPEVIVYKHEDGTKEKFLKHEEIGHGGFSVVYRVTHQETKKVYAIKVISKEFVASKGKTVLKELKNEMKIQKNLYHPNIVRSKMSFSDELNYYIVLEHCSGKSIHQYLKKSEKGYLSEPETRIILRDVVRGLIYLHSNNIIHHDLKLENFLIDLKGKVKIGDFGLATILKNEDKKQYMVAGTTNYLSPEVIQKEGHRYEVDIWAVGVAAFIMLTGQPPFNSSLKEITFEKIINCDFHFPSNIKISSQAKDFIKSTLKINPQKRPTAFDLYNHPFLTKIDEEKVKLFDPIKLIHEKVHLTINKQSSQKVDQPNSSQSSQKIISLPKYHVKQILGNKDRDLNEQKVMTPVLHRNIHRCSNLKTPNSEEYGDSHKKPNLCYNKSRKKHCLHKISPLV